ncbi:VOC family protein [Rhizobium sp. RAF36]|uniref:VOC family protein n=1 Tax=Rhizobium sp. RAF36 TaxID=3233055 RepID=UPI003F97F856
MTHPLDHLVLPVTHIDVARERLGRLGFTVAADGRHPFGTENACIFLADRTYLEPLGVANQAECDAAVAKGNSFVARDQAFRFRCGDDGFSAIVFGTDDADADKAAYDGAQLSGGDMVEFSRPIVMPDETQATGAFKLAFAADLRAPDVFFFACQRVNAFPADRKALETHANGVIGISEIALSAEDPQAFAEFLETASGGAEPREAALGLSFELPNGKLSIFSNEGMEAYFDAEPLGTDNGLRARAIVFSVGDLAVTAAHLAANGITHVSMSNRLLVKPAPGQGAIFAFEEIQ